MGWLSHDANADEKDARFDELPDEILLARAKDDPEAFAVFVRRHHAAVLGKMLAICRDADLAREITNDAFVKAYMKAHTYTPREGVAARAWLMRIAFTTFLSHYRTHKRQRTAPLDPETEFAVREASCEWYGTHELRDLVATALAELPEDAARLLRRYYLEGYTYADIARLEGISYAAAKVRMFRARAALRRILVAQGYGAV